MEEELVINVTETFSIPIDFLKEEDCEKYGELKLVAMTLVARELTDVVFTDQIDKECDKYTYKLVEYSDKSIGFKVIQREKEENVVE